jgi:hypothetical protein
MLLVHEYRAWHRELVNSRQQDPRVYSEGDIIFARQAMQSSAKHGKVDKLMHAFTGPWHVLRSLPGASYKLEFVHNPKRRDKKHALDLSPYLPELIPFKPVDSTDSCYGQLYKPIGAAPFKEAGIEGFKPPQPLMAASHFITKGNFKDFHFPTLSELNNEICPFPWVDEAERQQIMAGDEIEVKPILYHGPLPLLFAYKPPSIPPISSLIASIINLQDKLFFISHSLGNPTTREWRLVRVAYADSTALSPSCLQDGRFLVEFYTLHHANICFNACNQQYWLQYHSLGDIVTPLSSTSAHLIWPLDTSEAHVATHRLMPFRRWLNLTHSDTYIHGPFDFASINAHKTRDRISQLDWDILFKQTSMFHNPLPQFDLPSYSIHVNCSVHVAICNTTNCNLLLAAANLSGDQLYP